MHFTIIKNKHVEMEKWRRLHANNRIQDGVGNENTHTSGEARTNGKPPHGDSGIVTVSSLLDVFNSFTFLFQNS